MQDLHITANKHEWVASSNIKQLYLSMSKLDFEYKFCESICIFQCFPQTKHILLFHEYSKKVRQK